MKKSMDYLIIFLIISIIVSIVIRIMYYSKHGKPYPRYTYLGIGEGFEDAKFMFNFVGGVIAVLLGVIFFIITVNHVW